MSEHIPTKRTIMKGITTSRPSQNTPESKNLDLWEAVKQINARLEKLERAMKPSKRQG
jgi:hypothetical protein